MRSPLRSLVAVAGTLALATSVVACGGSSALTASEYKSQANKLCRAGAADVKKLGKDLTANSTRDEIISALNKVADRILKEVDQLKDLTPPSSLESDVNAMLKAVTDGANKVKDDPAAVIAGTNPLQDASDKADALGLSDCASGSS